MPADRWALLGLDLTVVCLSPALAAATRGGWPEGSVITAERVDPLTWTMLRIAAVERRPVRWEVDGSRVGTGLSRVAFEARPVLDGGEPSGLLVTSAAVPGPSVAVATAEAAATSSAAEAALLGARALARELRREPPGAPPRLLPGRPRPQPS